MIGGLGTGDGRIPVGGMNGRGGSGAGTIEM